MIPLRFNDSYDPGHDERELDRRDARREEPVHLDPDELARAEAWFAPILEAFEARRR